MPCWEEAFDDGVQEPRDIYLGNQIMDAALQFFLPDVDYPPDRRTEEEERAERLRVRIVDYLGNRWRMPNYGVQFDRGVMHESFYDPNTYIFNDRMSLRQMIYIIPWDTGIFCDVVTTKRPVVPLMQRRTSKPPLTRMERADHRLVRPHGRRGQWHDGWKKSGGRK